MVRGAEKGVTRFLKNDYVIDIKYFYRLPPMKGKIMTDTANTTPTNLTPNADTKTTAQTTNKVATGEQIAFTNQQGVVQLNMPTEANQQAVVKVEGVQQFVTTFNPDEADVSMRGDDVVIKFANGSETVLEDFALQSPMPQIILPDGSIVAGDIIVAQLGTVGEDELMDLETAAGGGAASGGGSTYSDDLGSVIDMLGAEGPIGFGEFGRELEAADDEDPLILPAAAAPGDPAPTVGNEAFTVSDYDTPGANSAVVNGTIPVDYNGQPGSIAPDANFANGGSLMNGTLSSNGSPVTVTLTGNTFTGTTAGGTTVFTMTINPDGTYAFELLEPLDHADVNDPADIINLTFPFTATDGTGDQTPGTVTVNVTDGVPTSSTFQDTSDDDALNVAVTGTVSVNAGPDGSATYGLGDNGQPSFTSSSPITSGGNPVTVTLVAGQYVGTANGQPVFTLDMNPNGSYTFTQLAPLDHQPGSDSLTLSFGFETTDFDGDSTLSTLNILVDDSQPTPVAAVHVVDETSDLGVPVTGSLAAGFGADGAGDVVINNSFSSSGSQTAGNLTSNGDPVTVTFDQANGVYTGSAGGQTVFTMTINQDGTYSFVQVGPLDHADGANANDAIILNFGYTITDFDGDSASGNIEVTVLDDAPAVVNNANTVDESTDINNTLNGTLNVDYGSDGAGSVAATGGFNASGSMTGGALTSNGQPVTVAFDANTGTYTGTAGGATVFTLTLNANGTYSFSLLGTLDHADGTNPNDIITLSFEYEATDFDGDSTTNTLNIRVADDAPLAQDVLGVLSDESSDIGTTLNGVLTPDAGEDGLASIDGTGSFSYGGSYEGTQLTSNGQPVTVIFDPATGTYTGSAGGTTVFTLVIDSNGQYDFTLLSNLDHGDANDPDDILTLKFGYSVTDNDGDTDSANLVIEIADDAPQRATSTALTSDETSDLGVSVNGQIGVEVVADGIASIEGTGNANLNGMTSNGLPVTVALVNGSYVGTAGGQTVFTIDFNVNGTFTFTQLAAIDHANTNDHNDPFDFTFEFEVTDGDGDSITDTGTIRILDDGPVAFNDVDNVAESGTATGNVITGAGVVTSAADDGGADGVGQITNIATTTNSVPVAGVAVTVPGLYGVLTINPDGSFSYAANTDASLDGIVQDVFTYTLSDGDGDTTTATLTLNVDFGADDVPVITPEVLTVDETGGFDTVNGQLDADFGADAAGASFAGNGQVNVNGLTSNGSPILVSYNNGLYTGTTANSGQAVFTLRINSDGTYTFTQLAAVDHPNTNNPNDRVDIQFGFTATDGDNDSRDSTITVRILDDGPVAFNDVDNVAESGTATGNVITGVGVVTSAADNPGFDGEGRIVSVDGTPLSATSAVTIQGQYGTLVMNPNGSFSYVANTDSSLDGILQDVFTYTLTDRDGDTTTATLTLNVDFGADDIPVVTPEVLTVDETGGFDTVNGQLDADFGADAAGASFAGNGQFNVNGLTSNGQPISVTYSNGTYTGTAGGVNVFTMTINANGTYTFRQLAAIDHPNTNNHNDNVQVQFGFTATDGDNDSVDSTITVNILDDGPTATPGLGIVDESDGFNTSVTANVGFDAGADGGSASLGNANGQPSFSFQNAPNLTSGGQAVTVALVNGQYVGTAGGQTIFTLSLGQNGQYTFTQYGPLDHPNTNNHNDALRLDFGYTVTDGDGDTDTANITISVLDDGPSALADFDVVDYNETFVTGNVITGTGMSNGQADDFGNDGAGRLVSVTNNGQVTNVPATGTATIVGQFGTLQIGADGSYTFTPASNINFGAQGFCIQDFNYTIVDNDGDRSTTTLTFRIEEGASTPDVVVITDETINIGDIISGQINPDFGPAGTGTVDGNGSYTVSGSVAGGSLTSDGQPVNITYANGVYTGTAGGQTVFTLTINANGTYAFELLRPVDHADVNNPDDAIQIVFGYSADPDGPAVPIDGNITVTIKDDGPTIQSGYTKTVDETINIGDFVTGRVQVDYGADGKESFAANGQSDSHGLTSNGQPIVISFANGVYTGTAGGQTVFTLTVLGDGRYTFRQLKAIDHPNTNNPNDAVELDFGVTAVDGDGDSVDGTITITVLDDGPVARNDIDTTTHDVDATGNVITGANVTTPGVDTVGADGAKVTHITFGSNTVAVPATGFATLNGQYGTLKIFADGSYVYDPVADTFDGVKQDTFTYRLTDGDGDVSNATLRINTDFGSDDVPVVTPEVISVDETGGFDTVNGQLDADFGTDAQGASFDGNGQFNVNGLTSGGQAINVTYSNGVYTGTAGGTTVFRMTINDNGSYTFRQFAAVDHPNTNNHNDSVSVQFGFTATDGDNDSTSSTITVNILDDGPKARNDIDTTTHDVDATGNVITGVNVTTPGVDTVGADGAKVTHISFNGNVVGVPATGFATIAGQYGTLKIYANGAYIYDPVADTLDGVKSDTFGYVLTDGDGDTSTATLKINTDFGADTVPVVGNGEITLDETFNIGQTINGSVSVDFRADGPGSVYGTGTHTVAGMTSGGDAITVAYNSNNGIYTGTADGRTVFTLRVNADGTYRYTQYEGIDHPNANDHNDMITMRFGIQAVDGDGSTSNNGVITINVCDDGPQAGPAAGIIDETDGFANTIAGNIFIDYGADDIGGDVYAGGMNGQPVFTVLGGYPLTVNGQPVLVTVSGDNYYGRVGGDDVFRLTVNENGTFEFTLFQGIDHPDVNQPNEALVMQFGYTVQDGDGDRDVGTITISVLDDDDGNTSVPGYHYCGQAWVNDVFVGTDGDDIFQGGWMDADTYTGGDGADTFMLESYGYYNGRAVHDTITDYDFNEGDVIDLTELIDSNQFAGTGNDISQFVRVDAAGDLQLSWDGGSAAWDKLVELGGYDGMVRFSVDGTTVEINMDDLQTIV